MKTVTLFLIFIGCYALYSTSEKAFLIKNTPLQKWFHNNKRNTKIIGKITLLIGLLFSINFFGLSAGIITWIVTASLFLSLIVLITPLRVINYAFLYVLFTLTFLIELLF
ncbi:hypothetical protein Q4517_00965 [Tenacibaculum sp. 1_MG-2023]|uniref:hypothetical protein n=1 Tax=Tenacibaculum sp. 1_MG-2023 TaxID=3062653 RepID=UPI0026E3D10B|nr:hypothetical protein [Tenacibaculum sp. 1_MG-2023]MDO6674118.1 hypothetical protein [Tenacibaculum sp. 1_MG-2023]